MIRVAGNDLKFSKIQGNYLMWSKIDGLKFSVAGIIKQFPDLKDLDSKEILIKGKERFKEHINQMESEIEIKEYLIDDLGKHGYLAIQTQRKGHRAIKCR